jgi:hypothetical protein
VTSVTASPSSNPEQAVLASLTARIAELASALEQQESVIAALQSRMEKIEREFGL